MNIDEIKKLVDGDPDTLIKTMADLGIDFKGLNKDIAKKMVRDRYHLTEEQFEAVDFIFWTSYFIERSAEELIIDPEIKAGARKIAMETMVGKLSFGDKITIIQELYSNKKDPLVNLMRKIQNFRNDIAHGRFNNLKYGGFDLSDNRGKIKLVAAIRDAFLKK